MSSGRKFDYGDVVRVLDMREAYPQTITGMYASVTGWHYITKEEPTIPRQEHELVLYTALDRLAWET